MRHRPLKPCEWPCPAHLVRVGDPVAVVCSIDYSAVADLHETTEAFALVSFYDERKPLLFLDINEAFSGLAEMQLPVCP